MTLRFCGIPPEPDGAFALFGMLVEQIAASNTAEWTDRSYVGHQHELLDRAQIMGDALMGFSLYPRLVDRAFDSTAAEVAMRWLKREIPWNDTEELDYLASAGELVTLCELIDAVQRYAGLSSAPMTKLARDVLVAHSEADGSEVFWRRSPMSDGPASPAVTAHAVLALASGNDEHQQIAQAGARWLLGHPERWRTRQEETFWHSGFEHRTYEVFALAPLAWVTACPDDPVPDELAVALDEIDRSWVESEHGWPHQIGASATREGTTAVLQTMATLEQTERSWDEVIHRVRDGIVRPVASASSRAVVTLADGKLSGRRGDVSRWEVDLGGAPTKRALLITLAGKDARPPRYVSSRELIDAGISTIGGLRGAAERINRDVQQLGGPQIVLKPRTPAGADDQYALLVDLICR